MSTNNFPALSRTEIQPSLDALRIYAQVVGKIRRALTPRHKHWWHVSLRTAAAGLTTTPIPASPSTFEMLLDLTSHQLVISTSRGERWYKPLRGQSVAAFCEDTLSALAGMGIHPEIDRDLFSDTDECHYDPAVVERYWQALSQVDTVFYHFKGELREETSPVQLWPHHFDLAMIWLSGRRVPDADPNDEEYADEQMNFGFAPGDESIPYPYFYITAYPLPEGLTDMPLPDDARWHTEGFTGAVLPYHSLVTTNNPSEKLLKFLHTVQQAGANLMLKS